MPVPGRDAHDRLVLDAPDGVDADPGLSSQPLNAETSEPPASRDQPTMPKLHIILCHGADDTMSLDVGGYRPYLKSDKRWLSESRGPSG